MTERRFTTLETNEHENAVFAGETRRGGRYWPLPQHPQVRLDPWNETFVLAA